jgi:hypothetical protein
MNTDDADRELSEADRLLRKADALLQRHRLLEEDDDLPLVTEIVTPAPRKPPSVPVPPATSVPGSLPQGASGVDHAERLVDIDTAIQRSIEAWLAAELPTMIERELMAAADRLQAEMVAHARATLLPRLSEEIASRLDDDLSQR